MGQQGAVWTAIARTNSFDSLILYVEDDGFRPWPNLPTGPR